MKSNGRYIVYVEKGYCVRCKKTLERMTLEEHDKLRLRGKNGRKKSANGGKKDAIL